MRLDKYVSKSENISRSEAKNLIKKGKVSVSDNTIIKPEFKVDESDDIFVNGNKTEYKKYEYYMLNKPYGYVSANKDNLHKTVISLIKSKKKDELFCVGRLDIDTEGLLIITNDGNYAHNTLSPKKHVDKTYYAIIMGEVTNDDILTFKKPIDITIKSKKEDTKKEFTRPSELKIISHLSFDELDSLENGRIKNLITDKIENDYNLKKSEYKKSDFSIVHLTINEGKYHQVKRMFESIDKPVVYLKRISFGDLNLDNTLKPGEYKEISI